MDLDPSVCLLSIWGVSVLLGSDCSSRRRRIAWEREEERFMEVAEVARLEADSWISARMWSGDLTTRLERSATWTPS